jgi:uncharacterized membrane protein
MLKIITIGVFCVFSIIVFVIAAILKMNGKGAFGKPTLPKYIFLIGKLSLFACFGLYIYALLQKYYVNPVFNFKTDAIAFSIFMAGMIIACAGLINLGLSLRMGLPAEDTSIKTNGIYRLTRNPIYVGLNLVCLASAIYYPIIINIIFFVTVCIYHHFVIKAEEAFLEKKFGNDWKEYSRRTGRYL